MSIFKMYKQFHKKEEPKEAKSDDSDKFEELA